jgi:integrase
MLRQFTILATKAGLSPIGIHGMRHTAATLMIRTGVNIKVVSETLGHSSIRVTLDIYGHLLEDQKQELADRMESLLAGA